ncbi:hypothetical protein KY389_14810 [Paracoccus bogoriensis]|uniref:hypothetical protein n=1 Tax=Paracoccus bogoriensis TaxID=242065 RepID=UPI001CA49D8B|nr:hypothetical protein [Paracoccus bogoriensis]MBW7057925.1 hypothetical protein [Paracoccus bogoriensis]
MLQSNDAALDAFLAAKAEIDDLLERLIALNQDHFARHPDEIYQGDVATLNRYRDGLREITDMAFREGEYAT